MHCLYCWFMDGYAREGVGVNILCKRRGRSKHFDFCWKDYILSWGEALQCLAEYYHGHLWDYLVLPKANRAFSFKITNYTHYNEHNQHCCISLLLHKNYSMQAYRGQGWLSRATITSEKQPGICGDVHTQLCSVQNNEKELLGPSMGYVQRHLMTGELS